jgi:rhamnosyltransferase subunit B
MVRPQMIQTIVTAPGSLGDVNPMLAIARALQQAGHQVLFLAAERYLPLAHRSGLRTHPLVTEEQFRRLTDNPDVWHPRHGARLIFQEAVEHFLASHYAWLEQTCEPQNTILVSHVLDFAGRVYRDAHPNTRFVSVLPAPALLRSRTTPPRLSGHVWERWVPRRLMPLAYRCADLWIDRIGGPPINQLRRSLGLPPVNRILHDWWWSPDLVLGLFPEWFSIAPQDRSPQLECIGFPLADSADVVEEKVTQKLQAVLGQFGSDRPIVFAPGTAHHHAAKFLESANAACRQLKQPGVLISTAADQFPTDLAPRVVTAEYLPFSQLLPHAQAIVHHGGVGTTSQALRAATPQVVVPMAFDQFDNAERVSDLGCGSWLAMPKQTSQRLAQQLAALPRTAQHVHEVAERIRSQPDATSRAVLLINQLGQS